MAKDNADEENAVDPRYIVPGLTRGLALLMLFSARQPNWSLAELAAALGITRSAVYRIVYTLEKAGFLGRTESGRKFCLTSKVLALGFQFLNSTGIAEIAQPFLAELSEKTKLSSYVAVLDGWHAVYLARATAAARLVSSLSVGSRHAAHSTASGRVLLSALREEDYRRLHRRMLRESTEVPVPDDFEVLRRQAAEDRERGYVSYMSSFEFDIANCALPIRNGQNQVVAAVTVIGHDTLFAELGGEKIISKIVGETAGKISAELGYARQ